MAKLTAKQKHKQAGRGLTILGEVCNVLGTRESIKNNSKLNDVVSIIGATSSIGSIIHFFGYLYNYDEEEGDSDNDFFISHLFTMVVWPVIDIYCISTSLKR